MRIIYSFVLATVVSSTTLLSPDGVENSKNDADTALEDKELDLFRDLGRLVISDSVDNREKARRIFHSVYDESAMYESVSDEELGSLLRSHFEDRGDEVFEEIRGASLMCKNRFAALLKGLMADTKETIPPLKTVILLALERTTDLLPIEESMLRTFSVLPDIPGVLSVDKERALAKAVHDHYGPNIVFEKVSAEDVGTMKRTAEWIDATYLTESYSKPLERWISFTKTIARIKSF